MVFTSLKLTAERLGIRLTERWIFSILSFLGPRLSDLLQEDTSAVKVNY